MNKLLKTLSITAALIITGNIFLPFGIYAKTFEPVQNPNTPVLNESNKQKLIHGLEELGFSTQDSKLKQTNKKNISNETRKTYLSKIPSSLLSTHLEQLNKLKNKSEVEEYLSSLPIEDVLAIMATTVPSDKIQIEEKTTKLTNSVNSTFNAKNAQTRSYNSYGIYCNEYRYKINSSDYLSNGIIGGTPTLEQVVTGCLNYDKWENISIQHNVTTRTWNTWITNPSTEEYCYMNVSYPLTGNEYVCNSKATWEGSGIKIYGIGFNVVWGDMSITTRFTRTWSWSAWRSVSAISRNSSAKFCRIGWCTTTYK